MDATDDSRFEIILRKFRAGFMYSKDKTEHSEQRSVFFSHFCCFFKVQKDKIVTP